MDNVIWITLLISCSSVVVSGVRGIYFLKLSNERLEKEKRKHRRELKRMADSKEEYCRFCYHCHKKVIDK